MERVTHTIEDAVEAIGRGEMIVVVDDPGRENEGDLVMAADAVTPEAVNFMVTHGRGLVCLPMEAALLDRLKIGPMVRSPRDAAETNFTVSIDLEIPGSTGISAADRARTIRAAVAPEATPGEFRRPGHVFPLRAVEGGVLARRGHTEASVDLARLAGRVPAGVICEIMADDGTMARGPQLVEFAEAHGLPLISIADLVKHRLRTERGPGRLHGVPSPGPVHHTVARRVETPLPTRYGSWRAVGYESVADGAEQIALVLGDPASHHVPLVRIHSECLTGDVFRSRRCDCGEQLETAMRLIAAEGAGAVVYVRGHEGRGIGLVDKLFAYALQTDGLDTVDANLELGLPVDARSYDVATAIVADLGLTRIRLMTNNPDKVRAVEGDGIEVVQRIPLRAPVTPDNGAYLRAKRDRLGHLEMGVDGLPAAVASLPARAAEPAPERRRAVS